MMRITYTYLTICPDGSDKNCVRLHLTNENHSVLGSVKVGRSELESVARNVDEDGTTFILTDLPVSLDLSDGDGVIPFLPGAWQGLPPESEVAKLWRAHEAEAQQNDAEFYNYGRFSRPGEIHSTTSRGYLDSWICPTGQITHEWTPYRGC